MTGCRLVECKQLRTNDKKSNNPLPHNTEKYVALAYSKILMYNNRLPMMTRSLIKYLIHVTISQILIGSFHS